MVRRAPRNGPYLRLIGFALENWSAVSAEAARQHISDPLDQPWTEMRFVILETFLAIHTQTGRSESIAAQRTRLLDSIFRAH